MEVTVADVAGRWVGDGAPEAGDVVAQNFISDALTIVRHEFSTVDARIEAGTLNADVVRMVVVGMVIRALQLGVEYRTAWSEGRGPFTESASYAGGGEEARRLVFLTDHEREMLRPAKTNGERFFMVGMGEKRVHTEWPYA